MLNSPIPARPGPDREIVLNADRIAAIRANTERASTVLGAIFPRRRNTRSESEEVAVDGNHNFPGLDKRHADLVSELLTRPHWEETEFEALASRLQLMAGGALEVINEWSFGRFDDLLIEEHEGYTMNPEVTIELRD